MLSPDDCQHPLIVIDSETTRTLPAVAQRLHRPSPAPLASPACNSLCTMASTLLEETRQYHEDMERLERLIVKDFKTEPKSHKEKLMQGHRVRQMLESLQQQAQRLVRLLKMHTR